MYTTWYFLAAHIYESFPQWQVVPVSGHLRPSQFSLVLCLLQEAMTTGLHHRLIHCITHPGFGTVKHFPFVNSINYGLTTDKEITFF